MASACGEGELKGKPRLKGQLSACPGADHTQLLQNQMGHAVCAGQDGWGEGLWEVNLSVKPARMYSTVLCCAVPRINWGVYVLQLVLACILACYPVLRLPSLILRLPSLITLARCCTTKAALSGCQCSVFWFVLFFLL